MVEFEKFQKDVRPMIEAMPGRSAAFYAEMLGQHISSVSRRLNEMQRMGILFSDRRRRKRMKNKTALWWIKGCEPEDMDSVETPEEQIIRQSRKSEKNTQPAYQEAADYLNDDQWVNEISKSREQRRLERLRAQDAQMPIPSYAEFFRQQAGRN